MPYPYERANAYDSTVGGDNTFTKLGYYNLTGATTATITTTPGVLDAVVVNRTGGNIAVKDGSTTVGTISGAQAGTFPYHAAITSGLSAVVGSTAASDFTLIYR